MNNKILTRLEQLEKEIREKKEKDRVQILWINLLDDTPIESLDNLPLSEIIKVQTNALDEREMTIKELCSFVAKHCISDVLIYLNENCLED